MSNAIQGPRKKVLATSSVAPTVRTDYTAVTATTTVSLLVRERPTRRELILTNTSGATLYLAFGRLPSSTDYTVALPTGTVFLTSSTDRINGVWASAGGGQVNITEEY